MPRSQTFSFKIHSFCHPFESTPGAATPVLIHPPAMTLYLYCVCGYTTS